MGAVVTKRYTSPTATGPRIAPRSARSLGTLERRLARAVDALGAVERAGEAARYRTDGLMVDVARSVRLARAALTPTRKRVASRGGESA
jgi:hypothetical protein